MNFHTVIEFEREIVFQAQSAARAPTPQRRGVVEIVREVCRGGMEVLRDPNEVGRIVTRWAIGQLAASVTGWGFDWLVQ